MGGDMKRFHFWSEILGSIILFIFITIFIPRLSSAGPSDILVYLPSYDFDIVNVGSPSAPQTFTIFNMRRSNLVIKTITLTGTNASDFSIVNDNCSSQALWAKSICTVDVAFEPTSSGSKNASLTISTNAPDVPIIDVSLSGIGVQSSYNTVTVLTPNGGEALSSGSVYTIWWGAPPEAVDFDLLYSIDNGSTWVNIANNVAGRSYNWVVPIPQTNLNECLVKVIGYDSSGGVVGEDTSDATFTIEVVKVTSPNGGETLTANSTWGITWKTNRTARPVANVLIYRSRDAGATWQLMAIRLGNPGSYLWTVPSVGTTITTGKIGVVLRDDTGRMLGFDISDNNVTVKP
jgi:hypothetical protein